MLSDLIKALQIMNKYGNPDYPTHCSHDQLLVCIDPADVSEEDIKELDTLGFIPDSEYGDAFISFKYGSA